MLFMDASGTAHASDWACHGSLFHEHSTRDEVERPVCAVLPDFCQNYAAVIVGRALLGVANYSESCQWLCFGNVRFDPRVPRTHLFVGLRATFSRRV